MAMIFAKVCENVNFLLERTMFHTKYAICVCLCNDLQPPRIILRLHWGKFNEIFKRD